MKNQVVIYNTSAIPDGLTLDEVFTYFELTGKLLWQEHTDGLKNHPPSFPDIEKDISSKTTHDSLCLGFRLLREGNISRDLFHLIEKGKIILQEGEVR